MLTVTLAHRAGSLSLDLAFTLTAPWTTLFGPSGSGKTTILRTIAGFIRPDAATVVYGPTPRVLLSTGQHVFVPAHLRPVRTAGQTARLFPHMTVSENVRYGLTRTAHEQAGREIPHAVLPEVMALLRLTALAHRRPEALSGGERQRVSVARAVASASTFAGPDKALLLLDEPFAGLDGVLRDELALALRDYLGKKNIPVLSVSHDVEECHLLRAEVIRIADGRLVEQGPVEAVLAKERERLLARLSVQPDGPAARGAVTS